MRSPVAEVLSVGIGELHHWDQSACYLSDLSQFSCPDARNTNWQRDLETQRSQKIFLQTEWPLGGLRRSEFLFLIKSQIWSFCSSSPHLKVNRISPDARNTNWQRDLETQRSQKIFLETEWPLGGLRRSEFLFLIQSQNWSSCSSWPDSKFGTTCIIAVARTRNLDSDDIVADGRFWTTNRVVGA